MDKRDKEQHTSKSYPTTHPPSLQHDATPCSAEPKILKVQVAMVLSSLEGARTQRRFRTERTKKVETNFASTTTRKNIPHQLQ